MAVGRQQQFLGQMRVDTPHLRALDSGVAYDFDVLAGTIWAGGTAYVVSGFELVTVSVGTAATSLQLITANSSIVHPEASESGSIFLVPASRATETLNAANVRVQGSFTPSAINYIGLDLRRSADTTTEDVVQFINPDTNAESPKTVPLARTLDYIIIISAQDFSNTPNVAPLANVTTDSLNNITVLQDARNFMFRLGSGGAIPDALNAYDWPAGRTEVGDNSDFGAADKAITSLTQWMSAAMTRLWEVGGGEHWYSPTADRNVIMARTGATVFSNGDWFSWDGTNLLWQGLTFLFDNSTAFENQVKDQTSSSAGLTNLSDGDCIYVDLDRSTNHTGGTALQAVKTQYTTLGTPVVPGSRYIIARRIGTNIITRDSQFPVNATFTVATTTSTGVVKLHQAATTPSSPIVLSDGDLNTPGGVVALDSNMQANWTALGAGSGITVTGGPSGSGYGGSFTGGGASGSGVIGTGVLSGAGGFFQGGSGGNGAICLASSGSSGIGVRGIGDGIGPGVRGEAGALGPGGVFFGGTTSGNGVTASGGPASPGVSGTGGATSGIGVQGAGGGSGAGVKGTGGTNSGPGGLFVGGASNGNGVTATGSGTGPGVSGTGGATAAGVSGVGGSTSGAGVSGVGSAAASLGGSFTGGPTSGIGAAGVGTGTGHGLFGLGGSGAATAGIKGTANSATGFGVQGFGSGAYGSSSLAAGSTLSASVGTWKTDWLGLPTGRLMEWCTDWNFLSTTLPDGWTSNVSGGSSIVEQGGTPTGYDLNTIEAFIPLTATTNYATIYRKQQAATYRATNQFAMEFDVIPNATSLATSEFYCGFFSNPSAPSSFLNNDTNFIAFTFVGTTGSTWSYAYSNGGTGVSTPTAVTATSGTVYKMRIEYIGATITGTTPIINFYINGALVGTVTISPALAQPAYPAWGVKSLTGSGTQSILGVGYTRFAGTVT